MSNVIPINRASKRQKEPGGVTIIAIFGDVFKPDINEFTKSLVESMERHMRADKEAAKTRPKPKLHLVDSNQPEGDSNV